jgi:hypothetical protein
MAAAVPTSPLAPMSSTELDITYSYVVANTFG